MKKKHLISVILIFVFSIICMIGCKKDSPATDETTVPTTPATTEEATMPATSETTEEATTPATILARKFAEEMAKSDNIEEVADILSKLDFLKDLSMVVMPVSEGYLDGFDSEIKGFDNAVKFSPMIGSIPFVAYIFETKDTDSLVENLKGHAILDWNICTVADELEVVSDGQHVFLVMAPINFE